MFGLEKKRSKIETPSWPSGYFVIDKNTEADWKNITEEKLNYIMEESRLYLQHIFDSTVNLTQKAAFLLTLISGTISFMFIEFAMKYREYTIDDWYIWPLAGYFLILFMAFMRLLKYVLPSLKYDAVGTPPEILLRKKGMMDFDYKKIIVSQLEFYQGRIDQNMKQNTQMAYHIKECSIGIIAYPVLISAVLFSGYILNRLI